LGLTATCYLGKLIRIIFQGTEQTLDTRTSQQNEAPPCENTLFVTPQRQVPADGRRGSSRDTETRMDSMRYKRKVSGHKHIWTPADTSVSM
jgi:hypothetical protein